MRIHDKDFILITYDAGHQNGREKMRGRILEHYKGCMTAESTYLVQGGSNALELMGDLRGIYLGELAKGDESAEQKEEARDRFRIYVFDGVGWYGHAKDKSDFQKWLAEKGVTEHWFDDMV